MTVINPIIYAELTAAFATEADLIAWLDRGPMLRLELPFDAAWIAGRAFLDYRRKGGTRTSPLPDLFIGAHAAASNMTVITRDPQRFRTYFPTVTLITP